MVVGVNLDAVRARRAELARMSEERKKNAAFYEVREGENKGRILPPWNAEGKWCKQAAYHYNLKGKGSLLCLKTAGQNCPACELVDQLFATKNPDDRNMAFKYKAKMRFFANWLSHDANDGKVYILGFGPQVEEQIINLMDGGDDGFGKGDITNPQTGYTLKITKMVPADKAQTKYTVIAANSPSPVPNWDAIKDGLHDLDALVMKDALTYEQMKAVLEGRAVDDVSPKETAKAEPAAPTVTDEFEQPKGATPQTKPVAEAKPAAAGGLSSALDKLRGMRK